MSEPIDAALPPGATGDELLELARAGEWRELARRGRFGLAAQTLRIAGGDPEAFDALAGLADVEASVRAKSLARARKRLEALERRPADLLDWDALGGDLEILSKAVPAVDQRDLDEARAALAGLRTEAFAAERDALLGTMAAREGDDDAALAFFEAALERDPNHVRALTNRGNVKLEAGDVDGAIADYERAIRLDESFANAHHNLGVAYRRKGQVGKSVAALRKAQRAAARRDADEVRASIGRGRSAGGPRLRWLGWGLIALLLFWLLRQRGLI